MNRWRVRERIIFHDGRPPLGDLVVYGAAIRASRFGWLQGM